MSKIDVCLWFDDRAEEAAKFYVETFRACGQEASLGDKLYYGEGAPKPKASLLTVSFTLAGNGFIALNGGPEYRFTPAISMMVKCKDQNEVDGFWERLLEGGSPVQCGWLTDKFGVSWQVTPSVLLDMIKDKDEPRAARVMQAMMKMIKLDVAALKRAYEEA